MLWKGGRKSENVEDIRNTSGSGGGRSRGGRVAMGGVGVLILVVIAALLGADPRQILQVVEQAQSTGGYDDTQMSGPGDAQALPPGDEQGEFASVILASTEDVWTQIFARSNATYEKPKLRIFSDAVDSGCGYTSAAVGPFYCSRDRRVYLDLSFFRELDERFGAPGDFAQAYVIGHEIGHHVQELLGVNDDIRARERGLGEEGRNELSVAVELQADCLAGVWAHHSQAQRQWFQDGDVDEGLAAAAAIGDDRIQREAGVRVTPESWTHGSSEQRVKWFRRGLETGDIGQCTTL